MNHSLKTGLAFGLTSGTITTIGLMVGLHSGTHSSLIVVGGILTIAVADAFSDALGIHIAEEAENVHTDKEKTKKFKVYGNCGMCKKTIEGSLKNVEGVSFAEWDKETGEMTVSFDTKNISLDDVKQIIADVGYDTDTHRAKEEVYNSLPGCCQYDRPNE